MAVSADGQLLLPQFAVMATRQSGVRHRRMTKAEPFLRNADDVRRSLQMAAAQAGDRAAYEALLRDCAPLIKRFASWRGVPSDYLDDVVQDVLLTVHRARHTYDPARSFTAWLRTIAERRAIDLLRRTGRQRLREIHAPSAVASYVDDGASSPREASVVAGTRVTEALAALPGRQREAVQLLVLNEQSLAEAAVTTRRSKVALKVNLHRALKALRVKFAGKD
jgi:RNA polymerase sigma factor (sigma-70 family)